MIKLDSISLTRLEKAALDSGFDLISKHESHWLIFKSSHCPLNMHVTATASGQFLVVINKPEILASAIEFSSKYSGDILIEHEGVALAVDDLNSLYLLLKKCFKLSRVLPSEPLNEFIKQTQLLPTSTEIERIAIQRVGQNIFRERLLEYWDGRCAVTGLDVSSLLRASHIKPWSECASDAERLDVFNGLLLSPNLDLTFDQGLITFSEDGKISYSGLLTDAAKNNLGFSSKMKVVGLIDRHLNYLDWHNKHIFKKS